MASSRSSHRSIYDGERCPMQFENTSAAIAAAESAKQVIAAAQAAAYLANRDCNQAQGYDKNFNPVSINHGFGGNFSGTIIPLIFMPNNHLNSFPNTDHQGEVPRRLYESNGFERSHYTGNEVVRPSVTVRVGTRGPCGNTIPTWEVFKLTPRNERNTQQQI